jgi:hypothetical protein
MPPKEGALAARHTQAKIHKRAATESITSLCNSFYVSCLLAVPPPPVFPCKKRFQFLQSDYVSKS